MGESAAASGGPGRKAVAGVTTGLLVTLAIQNAVPPFATDMYSPAFPLVAAGLSTTSALVGLSLTSFFIGMSLGQVLGGAISDQVGRRRPIVVGGLICTLGGIVCALAPSIGVLIIARALQGLGGGIASAVGRSVLVDLAVGDRLAKAMTLLMAIGGFAPMIAPVLGGVLASYAPWRTIFWCLAAFGLVMTLTAFIVVPESLPAESRHSGGVSRFFQGLGIVLRVRPFMGYVLISCCSGMCSFAYISDSSYVLQEIKGLTPLMFSIFFACNALLQVVLSFVNSHLVGRFRPRQLIRFGLASSACGVVLLAVTIFFFDTSLVATLIGFAVVIGTQAFIYGNTSAVALSHVRDNAGTGSAVTGLLQSLVNSAVAPIASIGGGVTAVPMVVVMIVGSALAWGVYLVVGRADRGTGMVPV